MLFKNNLIGILGYLTIWLDKIVLRMRLNSVQCINNNFLYGLNVLLKF